MGLNEKEKGMSMGAGWFLPSVLPGTFVLECLAGVSAASLSHNTSVLLLSGVFSVPVICANQKTGGELLY